MKNKKKKLKKYSQMVENMPKCFRHHEKAKF
jgi:hypothetical protein